MPGHAPGFYFCPAAIQPHTSVYSAFCSAHAIYTTHATKQRTGLYRSFSCGLTHSTAHDTRPTQAAIIPPAPRWSVSQRRNASSIYQIPTPRRDAAQASTAAYYNKVYKRSSDHAIPVGQSSGMDAAGGAELLAAIAASLFGLSPDSQ